MDIFVAHHYNKRHNKTYQTYFQCEAECIKYVNACKKSGLDEHAHYEVEEMIPDDYEKSEDKWVEYLEQFI